MKRVRQGKESFWERREEGWLQIVAAIILVAVSGYYGLNIINAINEPANKAADSMAPLNAGLGYLFIVIGEHWFETLVIIMGTWLLVAYIRRR